jgi:hypothetical protein
VHLLGDSFELVRKGVDGDLARFSRRFLDLDGKVDALGIGGSDLYVFSAGRRYTFKQIESLTKGVQKTPLVDGSGLKNTLEYDTIQWLQREGVVDFRNAKTLLVAGVDRSGMTQALAEIGADVTFGDMMFGLGLNVPIRSVARLERLAKILLPIVTRLPLKWIYPTGDKQKVRTPKFGQFFAEAQIIAGDWHFIRRFAPDDLAGKIVITQTVRDAYIQLLRSMGVKRLVTTTPLIGNATFATNVMEGVIVAHLGRKVSEITQEDYRQVIGEMGWKPGVIELGD